MRSLPLQCLLLLATAAGCASTTARTSRFQRELFANAEFQDVFAAAEKALARAGEVSTRDPATGLLRTTPTPIHDNGKTADILRPLNPERRFHLRRIGEIQVRAEGSDAYVLCRIVVEKNEGQALHTLNRNRGAYDQPTQTAAERDAAYSTRQNEFWTTVKRDRGMERRILRQIRQNLTPSQNNTP